MKPRWEILSNLCGMIDAKLVAEIGVSRGINAAAWLRLCPGIVKAYLVDIDTSVFDSGMFIEDGLYERYQLMFMDSQEAASWIPHQLDLVFIDADHGHEAVCKDIDLWLPKIRPGGILCGHDYISGIPEYGVVTAVQEKFEKFNLEDDVLEDGRLKIWWVKV